MGIIKTVNGLLKPLKIKLVQTGSQNEELTQQDMFADTAFMAIYNQVRPFTMTTVERCYALYYAVQYTVKNNIPGDFVECGVWRGGSSMMILKTLLSLGVRDRKLYMYDTYEGMSMPTALDGFEANDTWKKSKVSDETNSWCLSKIDEVKANISSTGYPVDNVTFVKGKVEDTIPGTIPTQIALLRLDTDWYESTHHELIHMFPLLQKNGVMIIDDYGHWEGAKRAVDEYFAGNKALLLQRIDYTGRMMIKHW